MPQVYQIHPVVVLLISLRSRHVLDMIWLWMKYSLRIGTVKKREIKLYTAYQHEVCWCMCASCMLTLWVQFLHSLPEILENYQGCFWLLLSSILDVLLTFKIGWICRSSYLHCEWRTADELELGDRRVPAKLRRFKQKKSMQSDYILEVKKCCCCTLKISSTLFVD